LCAPASEAGLTPLHCASQGALGGVIGRLHAFVAQEGEELFKMCQQRDRQIAHVFVVALGIAVCQSEELLLQRNGFGDQLFAGDRAVSDAGSGAEPMPQAEQTSMQSQSIPAESLRLCCFGYLQHTQDIAFEVRPAKLSLTLVILQIARTAIAAKDTGKNLPSSWTSTSAPRVRAIL